ncbi:DUF3601 domain-containing protein [Fusobacterium nucleatum]|uniref:DUF3601 domain-containing protein n=1 Tax=Fusobacterium nucleatum TaxID=851 RepID=UPI0030D3EAAB
MSKILLILPFVFAFIGIFTVIYIIYTTINEKRRKKLRDEEFKKIKETLFSYEFESTQKNAVNKNFDFENYLYSGDYVKVIKDFKDYYGFTYQAEEKFYFVCVYFLPYEDGYTLYISKNKLNISPIYLQNREETQGEICSHPEEYFEIIEQGRFKR